MDSFDPREPACSTSEAVAAYLDCLAHPLAKLFEQRETISVAAQLISKSSSVFTLGVGKSSYIAQKFAASLRSIGLPADFIHAGEALHGDLGRMNLGGVAIIVSKSGQSEELKLLLPPLKQRLITLVSITNRMDSLLGRSSDIVINTSIRQEGDEHNLLPLISTDVSLIALNVIVSLCARLIGLTPDAFRRNHPGGQLGFASGLSLDALPAWKARRAFVTKTATLLEAVLVMSQHKAGIACIVTDSGVLMGILSDGDLRRAIEGSVDLSKSAVSEWMNLYPRVVLETSSVTEALATLESGSSPVFAAPVVDSSGRCAGIVTVHDLVR